jgi:hypothetical protein
METGQPYRPRVSRETRLLLAAGLMAVAALWVLGRIRFPDRPVTPNPVPAVLSQLASPPKYDDLAREIVQLHTRLEPTLLAFDVPSAVGAPQTGGESAAIRLRDDLAMTWVPPGSGRDRWNESPIVVRDPASGLTVIRVPNPASASRPVPWTPGQPQPSRYLVASDVSPEGVSLRPVFVGSLDPVESPLWPGGLWAVPSHTDLAPGSFLFTSAAELAGLAITHGGQLAIVPGATVVAEAERVLATPPGEAGTIGIDVQELTPAVASLTGAPMGVVVTWVDTDGAAKEQLTAGDVIEAVDGRPLATRQHWDGRVARLSVGETISLRVRRRGETREVGLVALAQVVEPESRPLGLELRTRARLGAEVVRIDRGSAAERAGLAAGDLITLIADVAAPSSAQVLRSYTSLAPGEHVMVAVTRGNAHFVTTLER